MGWRWICWHCVQSGRFGQVRRIQNIASPWMRFFSTLRSDRDYFAASIMAIIAIYFLIATLILLFPFASEISIKRFHGWLPFYQWALLQPLPSMYNFENKVTMRAEASTESEGVKPVIVWINHHPRRVTGDGAKWWVGRFRRGTIVYESTYRNVFVRTVYAVSTDDDGVHHLQRVVEPGQ